MGIHLGCCNVASGSAACTRFFRDDSTSDCSQQHRGESGSNLAFQPVRNAPLHVGEAHIALSVNQGDRSTADGSAIQPGSDRALTFNHLGFVTIPPGATIVSDGISLEVPPLSNIAVSLFLFGPAMEGTEHPVSLQTSYAIHGDVVDAAVLSGERWELHSWYILTGVDVSTPGGTATVALGDSITDGWNSTENKNHRWPDYFAARLAADPATSKAGFLGVVNTGISANRLLLDGTGPNMISRINWMCWRAATCAT